MDLVFVSSWRSLITYKMYNCPTQQVLLLLLRSGNIDSFNLFSFGVHLSRKRNEQHDTTACHYVKYHDHDVCKCRLLVKLYFVCKTHCSKKHFALNSISKNKKKISVPFYGYRVQLMNQITITIHKMLFELRLSIIMLRSRHTFRKINLGFIVRS